MRIIIVKCFERGQIAEMIYLKNTGEVSKRRVKVISVKEDSFQAYCFLRNTKRTFKIENVLAFVPLVSKEREVM